MASLNKVQLIGNLGRDPELRYTSASNGVANFSVATSRSYKKNEEWVEETEWHNCVIWGDKATRFAETVFKGSKVYIEGRMQTTSWEDKELKQKDGKPLKHYKTEVVVDRYINLTGKNDSANEGEFVAPATGFGGASPARAGYGSGTDLDDLPF